MPSPQSKYGLRKLRPFISKLHANAREHFPPSAPTRKNRELANKSYAKTSYSQAIDGERTNGIGKIRFYDNKFLLTEKARNPESRIQKSESRIQKAGNPSGSESLALMVLNTIRLLDSGFWIPGLLASVFLNCILAYNYAILGRKERGRPAQRRLRS